MANGVCFTCPRSKKLLIAYRSDAMCSGMPRDICSLLAHYLYLILIGPEHAAMGTAPGQPSYCTLPMFHPPSVADLADEDGYISNDGHKFSCRNPASNP